MKGKPRSDTYNGYKSKELPAVFSHTQIAFVRCFSAKKAVIMLRVRRNGYQHILLYRESLVAYRDCDLLIIAAQVG